MYIRRNGYNTNEVMIMNTLHKLWEQHVMWTRSFIISAVDGLGDLKLVTNRLLRNPEDFANVLTKFYGSQKTDEFKKLFEQHLLIAADLVNAAKAGNAMAAEEARKKWYANADDIASFLASINPYWSKQEWQNMLYDHLKMTELEAVTRINRQFDESIKIYDDIEDQALKMADYMFSGIIRQFDI